MTQKETLNNLVVEVDALKATVASLEEKLVAPAVPVVEEPKPSNGKTNDENYLPTPPDYVEIVDTLLNKSFGVKFQPLKDVPAFEFTIVVPSKYSQIKDIEASKERVPFVDERTKVITYAEGANGVRLWTEKVFNSFDPDTQFHIGEDRPFANRQV